MFKIKLTARQVRKTLDYFIDSYATENLQYGRAADEDQIYYYQGQLDGYYLAQEKFKSCAPCASWTDQYDGPMDETGWEQFSTWLAEGVKHCNDELGKHKHNHPQPYIRGVHDAYTDVAQTIKIRLIAGRR